MVQHLLDDLIERGLDPTQRMLSVLDGAKALHKTVKKTFGECCEMQRCQVHKRRNVADHLSDEYKRSVDQRMRTAYAMKSYKEARAQLLKTVAWLDRINVSAAASLREGLEETLTLHRLELPEALRKSLSSTNLIESAFSVARDVTGRVKRWGSQGGYAVLAGKKIPVRRPHVRDRERREVALESYSRFQSPPRRQRSILARQHRVA